MKLRINVTEEILKASSNCINSCLPNNCAVALAVRDIFPEARVGHFNIIFDGSYRYSSKLPYEARTFIARFDSLSPEGRSKMTPISFDIAIPEEAIQSIDIEEVKKILMDHKTLTLI